MKTALLATKFFMPVPRNTAIPRPRLLARLNSGLVQGEYFCRKLTLISALPGSGKTALISAWLAGLSKAKAWLTLDTRDTDPSHFLSCLVGAIQSVDPGFGQWVLDALDTPQPPSMDTLLTRLLNELTAMDHQLIVVLDDFQAVDSAAVNQIVSFLLDKLTPLLHIVLISREDPGIALSRYRANGQMMELRAKDLQFSCLEVADFFSCLGNVRLAQEDISVLQAQTEGWAAALQFAALALQGIDDPHEQSRFIATFTGNHRFVLDYLMEEVFVRLPRASQEFLVISAGLGTFCGSLCDAIMELPEGTSRKTLEALDQANLFLVPLDGDRQWYRYHHLFAEFLVQGLGADSGIGCLGLPLIQARASVWFEHRGLLLEAFRQARASGDTVRAAELTENRQMPIHSRVTLMEILDWLDGLSEPVKNNQPALWIKAAGLSLVAGITKGVEESLVAAEQALGTVETGQAVLFGQIAAIRSTLAISQYRIADAKRYALQALTLLTGDVSTFWLAALWNMGMAHYFTGERIEARQIMETVLAGSLSGESRNFQILASLVLGELQEHDNHLVAAEKTFKTILQLSGEHPQPNICVACQGLARIYYQWNDLPTARMYAEQGLALARQYDSAVDRFVGCEVFIALLDLAEGKAIAAQQRLAEAEQIALKCGFLQMLAEIKTAQAQVLLRMGRVPEAEGLTLPMQIRIRMAMGEREQALELLETWTEQITHHYDQRLRASILRALISEMAKKRHEARQALDEAMALAEPQGFLRIFADEGNSMYNLILDARERGMYSEYLARVLGAFAKPVALNNSSLISEREGEVLRQLSLGLSNQKIADVLFISLHTVKVHVRNIYAKLETPSRTATVAKARLLGFIP